MSAKAKSTGGVSVRCSRVQVAPRKIRQVCDLIRYKGVQDALRILRFCEKREIALILTKLINSALDIAEKRETMVLDQLRVSKLYVQEGATLKRFRPRAQGRSFRISRRSGHIFMELDEV